MSVAVPWSRGCRVAAALCLSLSLVAHAGCFRQRHEAVQKESVSFVRFGGRTEGAEFLIENENGTAVWRPTRVRRGRRYACRPGVHTVFVRKRDELVVERRLLLADGQVTEVAIP